MLPLLNLPFVLESWRRNWRPALLLAHTQALLLRLQVPPVAPHRFALLF